MIEGPLKETSYYLGEKIKKFLASLPAEGRA